MKSFINVQNNIYAQKAERNGAFKTPVAAAVEFVQLRVVQVQVQVELYCHSATCGDIQWNEMSCLTGPRCYINTDIQQ